MLVAAAVTYFNHYSYAGATLCAFRFFSWRIRGCCEVPSEGYSDIHSPPLSYFHDGSVTAPINAPLQPLNHILGIEQLWYGDTYDFAPFLL